MGNVLHFFWSCLLWHHTYLLLACCSGDHHHPSILIQTEGFFCQIDTVEMPGASSVLYFHFFLHLIFDFLVLFSNLHHQNELWSSYNEYCLVGAHGGVAFDNRYHNQYWAFLFPTSLYSLPGATPTPHRDTHSSPRYDHLHFLYFQILEIPFCSNTKSM